MTDYTDNYAETNRGGVTVVCILDEGDITVSKAYMPDGLTTTVATTASTFVKGEWLSLSNDVANVYSATGGMPVLEKPVTTEDALFGRIIEEPRWNKIPTSSHTGGLADRLDKGYYRVVNVWSPFLYGIFEGIVMVDGTNAIVVNTKTLDLDLSESAGKETPVFKYVAAAAGMGFIPLTHVVAGTGGDTYSVLIGCGELGSVIA